MSAILAMPSTLKVKNAKAELEAMRAEMKELKAAAYFLGSPCCFIDSIGSSSSSIVQTTTSHIDSRGEMPRDAFLIFLDHVHHDWLGESRLS